MVVSEAVYEFDPLEFEALARDVGAELLMVSAGSVSVAEGSLQGTATLTAALSARELEGWQAEPGS
jgi:hypothetical protein